MISIVIPCYKERASLAILLPKLLEAVPEFTEIIVVGDGPYDGTPSVCIYHGALYINGDNAGLGPAIAKGIMRASNDKVIVMDGDGQHPVSAVAEIADRLEAGDPLVLGVRHSKDEMPWHRELMSDLCATLTRPLSGGRIHDPMTGLFGLDRRIVRNRGLNPNTWKIALEVAVKTEAPVTSVAYTFEPRIAGKSKASLKPAIQFLQQLIRLYAWKIDLSQMMRFCVVGTSGLVVNLGILTFLVELLGMDYRPAAIAGITVAMLWNYLWNKFWTFKKGEHATTVRESTSGIGHGAPKARES